MTDKPIIFSALMVRAMLDGRKTQTRRLLKKTQGAAIDRGFDTGSLRLPYAPGDRLYVREAFCPRLGYPAAIAKPHYRADDDKPEWRGLWKPSIHMPRWASRLTLTVTEVRVRRLQEIAEDDAVAEGVPLSPDDIADNERLRTAVLLPHIDAIYGDRRPYRTAAGNYASLWNSLHGPDAWDANPWCVAISFTVQKGNIDAL